MSWRPTLLPIARRVGRRDARAVGIVANEFFDSALGRMGGFGWAARTSAECLAGSRRIDRPPVLLAGRGGLGARRPERHESGIPLVKHDDDRRRYARRLDRAQVGLFLTVLARELGLEEAVTLHGRQNSAFVRRLLDEAHLFVLASREAADGDTEGAPVALMEAHASGLPVVSTRHAGVPEVVLDGPSGLLVPENDPGSLAGAIRQLIRDNEDWPTLGAAGRAHVEETFDVVPCTEELLGVYALAMSGRDDPRLGAVG